MIRGFSTVETASPPTGDTEVGHAGFFVGRQPFFNLTGWAHKVQPFRASLPVPPQPHLSCRLRGSGLEFRRLINVSVFLADGVVEVLVPGAHSADVQRNVWSSHVEDLLLFLRRTRRRSQPFPRRRSEVDRDRRHVSGSCFQFISPDLVELFRVEEDRKPSVGILSGRCHRQPMSDAQKIGMSFRTGWLMIFSGFPSPVPSSGNGTCRRTVIHHGSRFHVMRQTLM